jgi:hypothetical protein
MKEVLLLTEKVERTGNVLTEISKELREHDRRIVRLETLVDIAKFQAQLSSDSQQPGLNHLING